MADWGGTHGINFKDTIFMVQAALAVIRPRGYGHIVITSSITDPVTCNRFPRIGLQRGKQAGSWVSCAVPPEYARFGIAINAVMPGNAPSEGFWVQDGIWLAQMRATVPDIQLGDAAGHPLRRLHYQSNHRH